MCNVKPNEMYPEGCRGWRAERADGCFKCTNCPYSSVYPKKESSSQKEESYHKTGTTATTQMLYGTWARQFLPNLPLDELE